MSAHTPEPWHLYGPFDDGYVGVSSGEEQPGKRRLIAKTDPPSVILPRAERDSNARRIVACVNALKDMPGVTVEAGTPGWIYRYIASADSNIAEAYALDDTAKILLVKARKLAEIIDKLNTNEGLTDLSLAALQGFARAFLAKLDARK